MNQTSEQVTLKSQADIEKMRIAGRLAAEVLEMITPFVKIGVSTDELNQRCHDFIVNEQHATPAPLHYKRFAEDSPFPKSICTSLNHQVCHGIPSERRLINGDILNIDVTVIKDGYHGDTSKMFLLGKPSIQAERLSRITQECLYKGIQQVKPGHHLGDIGHAIQTHAEKALFSVVREYCGHGIGTVFHEAPNVLHYGKPHTGIEFKSGMIFTIEPMINAGKASVKLMPDTWTVITKDRSLSAQWEHTILVTETGFEILTLRTEERSFFAA